MIADLLSVVSMRRRMPIGKRYRRMDALGTPFCVTVDHQSKEDNTVTIRHRDSMEQERVAINKLKEIVLNAIG